MTAISLSLVFILSSRAFKGLTVAKTDTGSAAFVCCAPRGRPHHKHLKWCATSPLASPPIISYNIWRCGDAPPSAGGGLQLADLPSEQADMFSVD